MRQCATHFLDLASPSLDAQLAYKPLVDWSAKDVERWLRSQPRLRSTAVDCAKLLKGVTGAQLAAMTDEDLDDRGVPRAMRRFLLEGLILPTEEAQLDHSAPPRAEAPASFSACATRPFSGARCC